PADRGGGAHRPRRRAQGGDGRGGERDSIAGSIHAGLGSRGRHGSNRPGMSEATSELDERYERIRVTTDGSTRTIALAYPERRNAIGPLMTNELLYALEGAENDDGVRAIVITGEG